MSVTTIYDHIWHKGHCWELITHSEADAKWVFDDAKKHGYDLSHGKCSADAGKVIYTWSKGGLTAKEFGHDDKATQEIPVDVEAWGGNDTIHMITSMNAHGNNYCLELRGIYIKNAYVDKDVLSHIKHSASGEGSCASAGWTHEVKKGYKNHTHWSAWIR